MNRSNWVNRCKCPNFPPFPSTITANPTRPRNYNGKNRPKVAWHHKTSATPRWTADKTALPPPPPRPPIHPSEVRRRAQMALTLILRPSARRRAIQLRTLINRPTALPQRAAPGPDGWTNHRPSGAEWWVLLIAHSLHNVWCEGTPFVICLFSFVPGWYCQDATPTVCLGRGHFSFNWLVLTWLIFLDSISFWITTDMTSLCRF